MATAAVMAVCCNCGREFNDACGTGWCGPCELEVQAKQPPQVLLDMRQVYNGDQPQNEAQRQLLHLKGMKPLDFLKQLQGLERDYRASLRALQKDRPREEKAAEPVAEAAKDQGEGRVEQLVEQILKASTAPSAQ